MTDISIDLETLAKDNVPNSFICSIGAVEFDIETSSVGRQFYEKINLKYQQPGRFIDPDTVRWWLQQDKEEQNALSTDSGYTLGQSIGNLHAWIREFENPVVWGNGSIFDIAILENAFSYKPPWDFRNINDMRTILRAARAKGYKKPKMLPGLSHNALFDAQHQAGIISECWQLLTK